MVAKAGIEPATHGFSERVEMRFYWGFLKTGINWDKTIDFRPPFMVDYGRNGK